MKKLSRRGRPASREADGDSGANAYCKLPNSVVYDCRLGAETLMLLGFRATFVGRYALNRKFVSKQLSLGDSVFDRAIRQMQGAGYLHRRRAGDGSSTHARTIETLQLPPVTAQDGYVFIRRKQIEGLVPRAVGVLIFLLARPKGHFVFVREVAERFAWTEATASKWLNSLVRDGLARRDCARNSDGSMNGTRYSAMNSVRDSIYPDGADRDGGLQDRDEPVASIRDADGRDRVVEDYYKGHPIDKGTPNTASLPSTSSTPSTPQGLHVSSGSATSKGTSDVEFGATSWINRFDPHSGRKVDDWYEALARTDLCEEACDASEPSRLAVELKSATRGRVYRELLKPAGLKGFFRLVAAVAHLAGCDVDDAKDLIIKMIADRFHNTRSSVRLNSWGFVGLMLFHQLDERLQRSPDDWSDLIPF